MLADKNQLAPILLFVYKRVNELEKTIEALKKNFLAAESELYIYSDSFKNEGDREKVEVVREFIKGIEGFKSVNVKLSRTNKGLANSIIEGVNEALLKHDKVIVLEDDLITTPNFLNYMNEALLKYNNTKTVFSISGYSFNLGINHHYKFDSYFLRRGWSWGWATWGDRWQNIDWTVNDYKKFQFDKAKKKLFATGGSDLNVMLKRQMEGKLDSWAIRWFFHQFKIGGLTLYPTHSKVNNLGFGSEATHTTGSFRRYKPLLDETHDTVFAFPDDISVDTYYETKFRRKTGVVSRLVSKIETYMMKMGL
jgi:hypothetical protein